MSARGIDRIERVPAQGATLVGYPVYDDHGNMIATLMRSGSNQCTLNDRRSYDAWGGIRTGNTTGEPHGRYCATLGHLADDESGFTYMRARYYEPGTGRFVSEDPAHDGWNPYAYCGNEPQGRADSTGRFMDILLGMGVGALVGLVSGLITIAGQAGVSGISARELGIKLLASVLSGAAGGGAGAATNHLHSDQRPPPLSTRFSAICSLVAPSGGVRRSLQRGLGGRSAEPLLGRPGCPREQG